MPEIIETILGTSFSGDLGHIGSSDEPLHGSDANEKVKSSIVAATSEMEEQLSNHDMNLDRRLLQGDRLALTWFIETGQLDKIYEDLSPDSLADSNEERSKTGLCLAFLNSVGRKNHEEEQFFNPYLPSIGMEFEFGVGQSDPSFISYQKHPHRYPIDGPYHLGEEADVTIGEYSMHPSASPTTQLRDILELIDLDRMPKNQYFTHLTLSDLELSVDDTRAMLLQALIISCGYGIGPNEEQRKIKREGVYSQAYIENSIKSSGWGDNGKPVVYPYAKPRYLEMEHYKHGSEIVAIGTEFRFARGYESFGNLAKATESMFYLSSALIAAQKKLDDRDAIEVQLSEVWENLERDFLLLLQEHDIDASNITSCVEYRSTESYQLLRKIGTSYFDLDFFAHESELGNRARAIVIEGRRKVKELVTPYSFTRQDPDHTEIRSLADTS